MKPGSRRVVVTGMGAVCGLGHNVRAVWTAARQGKGAIAINFDTLAARTKQNHRPKLWVYAASKNEFEPFERNHRLHGHSLESVDTRLFVHGSLNFAIGAADRIFIRQIQLDSSNVSLVCDHFGVYLHDDR